MSIKNIFITTLCCIASIIFSSCGDPAEEVTSLNFSRTFAPTDFSVIATGINAPFAHLTWGNPAAVDMYIIEVFEGEEIIEGAIPVATFYTTTAGTETNPYVLEYQSGTYIARIKAQKDGLEDSKWTVLEKSFTLK